MVINFLHDVRESTSVMRDVFQKRISVINLEDVLAPASHPASNTFLKMRNILTMFLMIHGRLIAYLLPTKLSVNLGKQATVS